PHIDRRLNQVRRDYGINVLAPKGVATRDLMRALGKGRPVALMNDQKFNEGLPIPFFGHEAMTAPGPSRLAVKYNVPIVLFTTRRTGPARFEVTVHPPIRPDKSLEPDNDVKRLVTEITKQIETEVRANPSQWFWVHKRWPKAAWRDAGL
ncbi:MAG: lysophospholipid acyltransferase family protein, partial [Pseudomonadota bacterium]